MGRGQYNFVCDLCGRKRKASEGRLTWDNFFVCTDTCWQPRHPQDFVESRADDESVEIVRANIVQSMGSTTLSASAVKNATTVTLTSVTGLANLDSLGIELDTGECHWTYSNGTPTAGGVVTLGSYLPGAAASGNTVHLPSINNETYLTAAGITATGL